MFHFCTLEFVHLGFMEKITLYCLFLEFRYIYRFPDEVFTQAFH